MLIVLSVFFAIIWLIFFKLQWLPWNRGWKFSVYTAALVIALVVVGALQYYTPASKMEVVEAQAQQIYPLVSGQVDRVDVKGAQPVSSGDKLFSIDPRPFKYAVDKWADAPAHLREPAKLAQVAVFTGEGNPVNIHAKILQWISTWMGFIL